MVIGKAIVIPDENAKTREFKEPPVIEGTNDSYDSVQGHTGGSDVYMVYKNVKTYPGLLVRFQL